MKRIYITTAIVLLLVGQLQAQTISQLDLIKSPKYNFDGPTMDLIMKSGTGLSEIPVGAGWRNQSKFTGLQDAQGNQIRFSMDQWDTTANAWIEEMGMTQSITYNASNKPVTNYFVLSEEGVKIMSKSQSFSYDGTGKYLPVRNVDSIFDPSPMAYESTDSMVYDANGRMEQRITVSLFMGFYLIGTRLKYSYNASGQLIEVAEQDYDGNGQTWDDGNRVILSYNAANLVNARLEQQFNDPVWTNSNLDSFFYDGSGRMTSKVNYSPNGASTWIGDDREDFVYTGDQLTEDIKINWIGGTWVNEKKLVFTYTGSVLTSGLEYQWSGTTWSTAASARITWSGAIGLSKISNANMMVYPNPALDYLNISGLTGPAQLRVLDLQGKEYLNVKLADSSNDIYLGDLASGLYLVLVQQDEQLFKTRLVKQ